MVFLRLCALCYFLALPASAYQQPHVSRRKLFSAATSAAVILTQQQAANAAPPFAIMAEELGYFPVKNSKGEVKFVPKRVSRQSSEQAMKFATYLKDKKKVVVYETYWCPHSARQRELFGREAWGLLTKVECSDKGFAGNPRLCGRKDVDGYPTWSIDGKLYAGERSLSNLVQVSGYQGKFDESQEVNLPGMLGGGACQ